MNLKIIKETKILFIIFLTITIFLRLTNILSEQIWEDESISLSLANAPLDDFWKFVINDVHPPLYYLILKGWCIILGGSIFSGRLLSVIFSVLTAPILYLIGKEIKNKRLGLIIMFLYSISPFSIFYANEIRSYSLIHLFFTIDLYYATKCLKESEITKNYLFLGIFGSCLIYTHYMGMIYFGVLIIGIYFFNRKENRIYKNNLISILIVILSFIPWLPYAISDFLTGAPGYAGGHFNLIILSYWAFNYFLGPVPSYINDPYVMKLIIFTFLINLPLMVLSIISLIGFYYLCKKKEYFDLKIKFYFIILISCLLFGITIILGFLIENSFTAKNMIGGLSLIYICESFGLYYLFFDKNSSFLKNHKKLLKIFDPKLLKKIIYPILIALLITHIIIYPFLRAYYLQKPDWDGCFKRIKKDFKKHDIIIIAYDGGGYSEVMEYYSNENDFDLDDNFYKLNYDEDDIEEFFKEISKDNITRIWIINFWEEIRDPDDKTEELLIEEYDLDKIEEYKFRLDITLILYEVP